MYRCIVSRIRILGRLFGALLLVTTCSLELPLARTAESAIDDAQIQTLVDQLDDDLYATRETAQQQLQQVGIAAIEAVAEESQQGSLESATRSINILLSLSESTDPQIRVAALEKLIELPNRPKESKVARKLLLDIREQNELDAIVATGGYHILMRGSRPGFPIRQIIFGSNWKGKPADLKNLVDIPHAMTVSFHSAPIDSTAIEMLLDLRHIRRFEFYGTPNVSPEAIAKLKQRFPGATAVEQRSGAHLGVSATTNGSTRIDGVVKGSAAEKAGLMPNDLITELDGEKIPDFTTLTSRIAQHQPGDTVEVTLVRNREIKKVTVTFGRWGEGEAQLGSLSRDGHAGTLIPSPKPIRLNRR